MGKKRVEGKVEASQKRAGSVVEAAQARHVEGTAGEPEDDNRPVRCIESHTDREFRKAFRKVCRGLIEKAAAGSTAHTRLLLEMGKSGERRTGKRRGSKSLSEMLLDELKRRQDEREAAADKAQAEEQKRNAKANGNEDAASGEDIDTK